jgi:predicted O-methyltransferase YrrM
MKNEITTIRPRQIFKIVEDKYPDTNIELTITMPPSGIGSLLTLESSLLVALTKIINAKRIFEIGTFNGNTSLLLATNTPRDAIITTLDLPPEEIELYEEEKLDLTDANQNDQYLRQVFKNKGAFYIKRASAEIQTKIKVIHQNSHDFEPSAHGLSATQDIVFVDGGHDYATIKNDTEKALQMLKPNGVIIWHDYLSKIHSEVELYLRDFSIDRKVIAIGSTMLCFYPQGDFAGIFN